MPVTACIAGFYPECSVHLRATLLLTFQWLSDGLHKCPVCTGLPVAFKDPAVLSIYA